MRMEMRMQMGMKRRMEKAYVKGAWHMRMKHAYQKGVGKSTEFFNVFVLVVSAGISFVPLI